MALSQGKKAKIEARRTQEHREANIRAVAITKSLHSPFIESNWDAEARTYLATGNVQTNGFLARRFAEKNLVP